MDSHSDFPPEDPQLRRDDDSTFCWKEMLDQAFTNWEPADQALEKLIDRAGRWS